MGEATDCISSGDKFVTSMDLFSSSFYFVDSMDTLVYVVVIE